MRDVLAFLGMYPFFWGIFFTLIPIGILMYKRRRLTVSFRFLLGYLIGKFLSDLVMLYYASSGQNNLWLHNLLIPLRYFLLSSMFYYFLESPRLKKWIRISIPFLLIVTCADIYYSNQRTQSLEDHLYVRYSGIVECLLMLFWILQYFYEVFRSLKIENLLRSPKFLVSAAWLLYYACVVFFEPLYYYIYRSKIVLTLGVLEYIPDTAEILVVLTIAVAGTMISDKEND